MKRKRVIVSAISFLLSFVMATSNIMMVFATDLNGGINESIEVDKNLGDEKGKSGDVLDSIEIVTEEIKEDPKVEAVSEEKPEVEPKLEKIKDPAAEKPEAEKSKESDEGIKDEKKEEAKEEIKVEPPKAGRPSLDISVTTDKELYEFGDTLIYTIKLINNGEVNLENIGIVDDLNGDYSLEKLDVAEEKTLTKEYKISLDSNLEEIENNIKASLEVNGESFVYEAGFLVGFVSYFTQYKAVDNTKMMRSMPRLLNYQDTIKFNKSADFTRDEDGNIIGCRVFEVTLDITGTPPPNKPVDVVIVMDRSGSMSGTRIAAAKTAANKFADKILAPGNPGNRIAVVSYSTNAGLNLSWSSDLALVKGAINGMNASGRTNIEDGFIKAETQIDAANLGSNKAIVLLSDGQANESVTNPSGPYIGGHTKHTTAAYKKGEGLQAKAQIFTIGLGMGGNAVAIDTLTRAAQSGNYYPAPDENDLDAIYDKIANEINYSAKNVKVVDKIGDNFEFVPGSISLPAEATYDDTTKEITWERTTVITSAQLKYKVRAKDTYLGGTTSTNEYATLTYTDVNGDNQQKDGANPPVVVPAPLSIILTDASVDEGDSLQLGTGTDELGENFMSNPTGGEGSPGDAYTYEWRVLGDTSIIAGGKNPAVSPTVDTEYELTLTGPNGCIAIATMMVRVKKLSNIKVTKLGDSGEKLEGAEFTLFHKGGAIVNIAGNPKNTDPNGEALFSGVKNGEYTVKETAAPTGYVMDTESKDVTVTGSGVTVEVTFTNTPITGNIEIEKKDENGNLLAGGEFTLYKDGVAVTGITNPKTTDATGKVRFDNLDYGVYTVKETAAPTGYILDPKTETVTIANNLETVSIEFVNTLITADIKIIKVKDVEDGDRIGGAIFELRDEAGLVVRGPLTTNTSGEILMEDVPYGEYTLHETKAPTGYKRLTEPIDVVVNGEKEVIELRIINTENTWQIPNTGGYGGISFSIIGLTIMVLAGVIFIREYTKKIKVRS